jgi:hypothetical protein
MGTYQWSIPSGKQITGQTFIKDTDNNIADTMSDLVDFVNGEGNHLNQGLTYDLVDKGNSQTITGIKTFTNGINSDVTGDLTGNVTGDINGNSSTATKLSNERQIYLYGDATGTVGFDGSANSGILVTVTDDSHNHVISNIDGLEQALSGKQPTGDYITETSSQALSSTDALRISGSTISLHKADGTNESVEVPSDIVKTSGTAPYYGARAFGYCDTNGTVISGQNISSVGGTMPFLVTLTTPMQTTNYTVIVTCMTNGTYNYSATVDIISESEFRVRTGFEDTASPAAVPFSFVVYE